MESENRFSRRGFLKKTGLAVVGGGVVAGTPMGAAGERKGPQEIKIREKRTLGRTGFQVSDIGFGTGSLNNPTVLAVALDMGVNYIDTAEHYMNGQAERTVGEVLKDRDRGSIFLTTKLNMSMGGSTKEQIKERFQRCLERMQTDRVDCLMVHMTPEIGQVTHEGFHAAAAELKAGREGPIPGPFQPRDPALRLGPDQGPHGERHRRGGGRWAIRRRAIRLQLPPKGTGGTDHPGLRFQEHGCDPHEDGPGRSLAAGRTEALEGQLRSGRQVSESRQRTTREYQAWAEAAEEFKQQHGLQSATEVRDAAIKFVLAHSGVHSVCPTINTFEELEGFVALSGQKLSTAERPMLASYEDLLGPYYCRHACGICEPSCPHQVPVNTILRYGHYFAVQSREKQAMQKYAALSGPTADVCAGCSGHCEAACPYGVRAKSLLTAAHDHLTMA